MQIKETELRLQYPDKRTNQYIQEIQERLGVTKIQQTMEFVTTGLIGEFEGKRGDELTIHKHFNQFLVQFISSSSGAFIQIFMNREPAEQDLGELVSFYKLINLLDRGQEPIFICKNCGHEKHFLDVRSDTIHQKFLILKIKKCCNLPDFHKILDSKENSNEDTVPPHPIFTIIQGGKNKN